MPTVAAPVIHARLPWWGQTAHNVRWTPPTLPNYYRAAATESLSTAEATAAPHAPRGVVDATDAPTISETVTATQKPAYVADFISTSESVAAAH